MQHPVAVAPNRFPETVLAYGQGHLRGREDAAAGSVELLVARALRAKLELVHAVARKTRMRVAIDEPGHSTDDSAVELLDLSVERLELAHPADGRDPPRFTEEIRVLHDLDVAERLSAQRRVAPGRRHELREIADEEPHWLARRAHSAAGGGIGGSRPCCAAASTASS